MGGLESFLHDMGIWYYIHNLTDGSKNLVFYRTGSDGKKYEIGILNLMPNTRR